MADQLVADVSKFADLSGAVQSIIQDLSGAALSQTGLVGKLAKLVVTGWVLNLSEDKVQAQVLAAAQHLVSLCVPAGERALVLTFVDASVPAIVVALQSVADEVKAYLLKQASAVQTKVVEKVGAACKPACSPFLGWIQSLLSKKVAAAAAEPVAPAVAVPAETVAAPVEAAAAVPVVDAPVVADPTPVVAPVEAVVAPSEPVALAPVPEEEKQPAV
jgi:hypothetical protein